VCAKGFHVGRREEIRPLTTGLETYLNKAYRARCTARPNVLMAVYPVKTLAVSVTGAACSLGCSHCGGHYLRHMVDIKNLEARLQWQKPSSLLISGGCDSTGQVPLASCLEQVKNLGEFRLNVHPGVCDQQAAQKIARLATVVSFDFVIDDQAISQAFKGTWTQEDYIRALRALASGQAEVVPHILVGLRKGAVVGEYEALDFLFSEGVTRVIFIVFIPTKGTLWEKVPAPPVEDVAKLLAWTRVKRPSLDISLGCMRPTGQYRRDLDTLAVLAGVDRIVMPHPQALALAESKGFRIVRREECCAFDR
jgi:uncharacterized radical SAM superfamily protein